MVENNVGKEENAGYQHFLLYLHCFKMPSLSRLQVVQILGQWVKSSLLFYKDIEKIYYDLHQPLNWAFRTLWEKDWFYFFWSFNALFNNFSHIAGVSASMHVLLGFLIPVLT